MNMNYSNFENETFEILSGEILCGNFENCTFLNFDGEVVFDRCNIKNCKFKKPCKFVKSNVINELELKYVAENLKKSTFELSNLISANKEPEEEILDGKDEIVLDGGDK